MHIHTQKKKIKMTLTYRTVKSSPETLSTHLRRTAALSLLQSVYTMFS